MNKLLTSKDILLTTKDNKFNPFTEYDDWKAFDTDILNHPYNTEAYYARVLGMRSPNSFTDEMISQELVQVFEEIIQMNNEIGNDIYQVITPDGTRMDHVPSNLLFNRTT